MQIRTYFDELLYVNVNFTIIILMKYALILTKYSMLMLIFRLLMLILLLLC